MKYTIVLLLTVFGFTVAAQDKPAKVFACEDKLAALSAQGVDRGAFLQALKNVRSNEKPSRYVLMAHLGRKSPGTMKLVDTQTGKVEKFKMWHGTPENAGDSLNFKPHETTYFGGQHLKIDEEDFQTGHRIKTEIISPSLKNKLAARGDQPGGNQILLKCSKKFRENPNRKKDTINDNCMEPKDVDRVFNLLKAEKDTAAGKDKPKAVMFTYPTRNLDNYLAQVKLQNDEPDVCKTLEKMPANVTPDAAPSSDEPLEGQGVE